MEKGTCILCYTLIHYHAYGPRFQQSQMHLILPFASGQFWPAACGGGPHRRDGGGKVSFMSLSFDSITLSLSTLCTYLEKKLGSAYLFFFLSFSSEVFGALEDTEWRDTVHLYKEEVRKKWTVGGFFSAELSTEWSFFSGWKWLLCYRKHSCATTYLKGYATSGWTGREPFVVLGTETEKTMFVCMPIFFRLKQLLGSTTVYRKSVA